MYNMLAEQACVVKYFVLQSHSGLAASGSV